MEQPSIHLPTSINITTPLPQEVRYKEQGSAKVQEKYIIKRCCSY